MFHEYGRVAHEKAKRRFMNKETKLTPRENLIAMSMVGWETRMERSQRPTSCRKNREKTQTLIYLLTQKRAREVLSLAPLLPSLLIFKPCETQHGRGLCALHTSLLFYFTAFSARLSLLYAADLDTLEPGSRVVLMETGPETVSRVTVEPLGAEEQTVGGSTSSGGPARTRATQRSMSSSRM